MAGDDRLCERLAALLNRASSVLPVVGLGFLQRESQEHATFIYCENVETSAYRVRIGELSEAFQLRPSGLCGLTVSDLEALRIRLHDDAPTIRARQGITLPVPHGDPAAMLMVGLSDSDRLARNQLVEIEALAALLDDPEKRTEPPDLEIERFRRLDAIDALLPVVLHARDMRDFLDQSDVIVKDALPHDMFALALFGDDPSGLTTYSHPAGEPRPGTGARSSLHIGIWLDEHAVGRLSFYSREVGRFGTIDLAVGRRIVEHIAIALSHQRLAEQARRADAMRKRADNLEMLEDLLKALSGVLDLREVFDRVSEIAQKVLPHDAAIVFVPTGVGTCAKIFALRGFGEVPQTIESRVREPELLTTQWDYRIVDDMATHPLHHDSIAVEAGLHAALLLPVKLEGRLHAFLGFLSREPAHFTRDDVLIGRRIADHVALALSHQRLSEEATRNEQLRARTEKLELLDELLASVTGGGELPDVFDRVSNVTQKVLPHDALVLTAQSPEEKKARVHASQTSESVAWPEVVDVPPLISGDPAWEFDLVDDLQTRSDERGLEATKRGFRAALRLPIRLDGEYVAGVSFLSFAPSRYTQADIPVARRIADRLALSFLRERRNHASHRASEADARAAKLEARVRALTEELDARTGYRRVIGESASWRQVLRQAAQVAATETTVLLLGESGTGKEVIARFVHRGSARRDGPFIALNCAALPEQLLEAELFGYERGAFTGATQSKPGQLEQAGGGTLFLDEVAEMSPQVQAKFLRVLQEREFQRLGGTRLLRTDARVVAATNRDLQQAIGRGQFREDLFYRLNVFAIRLPPLRERKDDVLPLSEAFLTEYGRSLARPPAGISRDARKRLLDYHWPGNVRELRNALERAAILCDGGLIAAEHLALSVVAAEHAASVPTGAAAAHPLHAVAAPAAGAEAPALSSSTPAGALSTMERAMIEQALQDARFNKSKAAAVLGLTRSQLYARMKKYGLE